MQLNKEFALEHVKYDAARKTSHYAGVDKHGAQHNQIVSRTCQSATNLNDIVQLPDRSLAVLWDGAKGSFMPIMENNCPGAIYQVQIDPQVGQSTVIITPALKNVPAQIPEAGETGKIFLVATTHALQPTQLPEIATTLTAFVNQQLQNQPADQINFHPEISKLFMQAASAAPGSISVVVQQLQSNQNAGNHLHFIFPGSAEQPVNLMDTQAYITSLGLGPDATIMLTQPVNNNPQPGLQPPVVADGGGGDANDLEGSEEGEIPKLDDDDADGTVPIDVPENYDLPDDGEEAPPAIQLFNWSKSNYNSGGHFNQKLQIDTIYDTHIAAPQQELQADPAQIKKIAMLYAANSGQAEGFIQGYASNTIPAIGGSGQAVLFAGLAGKITQAHQQGQVHIIGLSTSKNGGANTPGNIVSLREMDRDLGVVAWHIAKGWNVIGPGRPNGLNAPTQVSIGSDGSSDGGASIHWRSKEYVRIFAPGDGSFVQYTKKNMQQGGQWTKEVKNASGGYSTEDVNEAEVPKRDAANVLSQDEYMQDRIQLLSAYPQNQWPENLEAAANADQPPAAKVVKPTANPEAAPAEAAVDNAGFPWGKVLFWVGIGITVLLGVSGLLVEYGIGGMSVANEFNQMFLGVFDKMLNMDIPMHEFRLAAIGFFSALVILALVIVFIRELILLNETSKAKITPTEDEEVTTEEAAVEAAQAEQQQMQQEQQQVVEGPVPQTPANPATIVLTTETEPPLTLDEGEPEHQPVSPLGLQPQPALQNPPLATTIAPLPHLNLDIDALLTGAGGNPTGADNTALGAGLTPTPQPTAPVIPPTDPAVTPTPTTM